MKSLAKNVLSHFQVGVKRQEEADEIFELFGEHLEAVIYNIVSVSVMLTMLQGGNKVAPEYMGMVRKYIQTSCDVSKKGGMTGGMSMASDYFGYSHPAYSAGNAESGTLNMGSVQFGDGIARQALGPQAGGGSGPHPWIRNGPAHTFLKKVLSYQNMKASSAGMTELQFLINAHIDCVGRDLSAQCPLTIAKLRKVFALKRHAIFH